MPVPREKSSGKFDATLFASTLKPGFAMRSDGGVLREDTRRPQDGGLQAGALYRKIETTFPTLTSSFTRAASQFAVRMQPWLAARPIVSGLFVP